VEQFDSVAIFGFNAPEWIMAAMSAIFCGAKCAGIYPTDTPEQIKYKCEHSGAKVMVLEDQKNLDKFKLVAGELPNLTHVVVWNEKGLDSERECAGKSVMTWKELVDEGKKAAATQNLKERQGMIRPGHCCALIYTSGTTGNPKAVMISHDNIVFESTTVVNLLNKVVGTGVDIDGNSDFQVSQTMVPVWFLLPTSG
jgi:long-chain-fatty-acid--CoA ligase ACSBG